jgi:glycosyltransferase involved in cell wall biosynthesis
VLYAGAISVAKGVPYLIAACQLAKNDCQLTLCGTMDPQIATWAQQRGATYELIPKVPRQQLPQVFRNYDVLVLPSLGDSFGFIALEAMASGLPVIVTDAAGVPVPDTAWRVPTHCANSIADRLVQYAQQRERLLEDSETATRFGRQFTAEQFRRRAGAIFTSLLAST